MMIMIIKIIISYKWTNNNQNDVEEIVMCQSFKHFDDRSFGDFDVEALHASTDVKDHQHVLGRTACLYVPVFIH